ncbi:Breast cancer type 2 susceptibility like protein [Termitomyces sp. T112]|nr:Breast cancer type 2 susceptibility like protein [Termitomyces sp. T112]KAH0591086.1 hypothetical protein H2248_001192 [Termitomyces sp. 'cryptogamus']
MLSYSSDCSPFSSPVRKRQRLSSPTYDEQLGDVSQADLDAFDKLQAHLSQSPRKNSSQIEALPQHHGSDGAPLKEIRAVELTDDPENPFTTTSYATSSFATVSAPTFTTASSLTDSSRIPLVGFSKASVLTVNNADVSDDFDRSSSPEEPPNQDYDAWFEPAGTIPPITFQSASSSLSMLAGFTKASNKGLIAPSSAALAKAQAKMREIWQESNFSNASPVSKLSTPSNKDSGNLSQSASNISAKSPRRPALQSVVNSPGIGSPSTPSPAGFSRPSAKLPSAMTPVELFISKNSKPFKSPLLPKKAGTSTSVESPRSTSNPPTRLNEFVTAKSQHPLASVPLTADLSSITTPVRHPKALAPGLSVKRRVPTVFVTPFKSGMEPGQPGRLKLEESLKASQSNQAQSSVKRRSDWLTKDRPGDARRATWTGVFNLDPPPNRQSLCTSGLVPQQYMKGELEAMGINAAELSQVTPSMAMFYSFHTPSSMPVLPLSSTPPVKLGPVQAFNSLLESGCTLATQDWVNNHWGLILWKLAGMVGLDPERESSTAQKRWCWNEVMRQLFYRYERELNQGKRPPLRLVTTRDAPAAYPMTLCVSDIFWGGSTYSNDNVYSDAHPELEVTDGWYRLRARIDAPMARAVRRGHIRIGRKFVFAGAHLSSEKKDGSEVLDSYDSVKLVISGNSSHMAPWHAKLGFSPGPYISSLRSLTPDGGSIAAMDFVVVKMHPIAYIEFIPGEGGTQTHQGPMNESEETAAHEKWKKRWEHEISKMRAEYEKRWERYEGYLDRLERRLGPQEFMSSQDDFPLDVIENIYDELEDPAEAPKVIAGLGRNECGSLARFIRNRLHKEKTHATQDMELELQDACPPRVVKSFRIIVVQDACTRKHPGNRKALLNVWDVLNLSFSEGASPGYFEIGQRFMVTNLRPTHHKSWMGHEPGAEVYLCTGQHSRWTPIRTR